MIRCETLGVENGKRKMRCEVEGSGDDLLHELSAITGEIFVTLAEAGPFSVAEALVLDVLAEGMKDGAKRIMGVGKK